MDRMLLRVHLLLFSRSLISDLHDNCLTGSTTNSLTHHEQPVMVAGFLSCAQSCPLRSDRGPDWELVPLEAHTELRKQ